MTFLIPAITILHAIVNSIGAKWLVKGEEKHIKDTEGKKLFYWTLGGLAILGAYNFFFVIDRNSYIEVTVFFIIFYIVLESVGAWFEWKYLEGKKHILTGLSALVVGISMFVGFYFVTYTSFAEEVTEGKKIKEIEVVKVDHSNLQEQTIILKSDEKIQMLLEELNTLKFEKTYKHPPFEDGFYEIKINETSVSFYGNDLVSVFRRTGQEARDFRIDTYEVINDSNYMKILDAMEFDEKPNS